MYENEEEEERTDDASAGVWEPLASITGTILAVYSFRFVVYSPQTSPLPEIIPPVLAAWVGFIVGVLLAGWGLTRLGIVRVP